MSNLDDELHKAQYKAKIQELETTIKKMGNEIAYKSGFIAALEHIIEDKK